MDKSTRIQHARNAERGSLSDLGKALGEWAAPTAPVPLPVYTVATVPDAAAWTGHVIFVSDGAEGDPTIAYSDGTDWIEIDGTAIDDGA